MSAGPSVVGFFNCLKTFLNESNEIHAFVHGLYCGLTEWNGIDNATMEYHEVLEEPHYARGGYIVGTLFRIAMILWFGCEYLA